MDLDLFHKMITIQKKARSPTLIETLKSLIEECRTKQEIKNIIRKENNSQPVVSNQSSEETEENSDDPMVTSNADIY